LDTSSDTIKGFLEQYKNYVETVLAPTRKEIQSIFGQWRKPGYWEANSPPDRSVEQKVASPAPVQRVHMRIKRAESVVDKILRRPDVFEDGLVPASFRKMNDTLGVRVVLYFLCHMPLIDRELTRKLATQLEVSNDYKPKAYLGEDLTKRLALLHLDRAQKESGYASIHYILRLKDSRVPLEDRPWFELQVRTLTEDTWGEVEHLLGYKPGKRTTFAVRKQFQIISKLLGAIDEHFNLLFEELSRFQAEVEYKETDLLNAETLPPELATLGLGCAQNQIDGLLKLLTSRNVSTVLSLRNLAQQTSLEIIRNTYTLVKGRPANNFEVVANLANLAGCNQEAEQIERIKEWIAFLDTWEELKDKGLV
jgi:putative GTP pyrophosphokinase